MIVLMCVRARAGLQEEVHKVVEEVERTRKWIMDAATLHAQRREAHAERMARLEHQAAHILHARQLSGPLHLNGFNLRPSAHHDHVEPSTEEDEAQYLEAAIRASLSFHSQLHTPSKDLDRPHSTQSAPPKQHHATSSGRSDGGLNSEECGLASVPEPGTPDLNHAHGRVQSDRANGMHAPQTEPRRMRYSNFARNEGLPEQQQPQLTAGSTGGEEMNGGSRGRLLLQPHSHPISSSHTPISPATVYRAFEQTQEGEGPHQPHQRPHLNGGSHSEWLDFEERDPHPPTREALAHVRDRGGRTLVSEPDMFFELTPLRRPQFSAAPAGTVAPGRGHGHSVSGDAQSAGPGSLGDGAWAGEGGWQGGSEVLPVKVESLNSLTEVEERLTREEEAEWDLTDADRMSDHESGGEQEPGDMPMHAHGRAVGAAVRRLEARSVIGVGRECGGGEDPAATHEEALPPEWQRFEGNFAGDASCVGGDSSVDFFSDDCDMPVPVSDLSGSPSGLESPADEGSGQEGVRDRNGRGWSGGREGAETPPLPDNIIHYLLPQQPGGGGVEVGISQVANRMSGVPRVTAARERAEETLRQARAVLVLRPAQASSSASSSDRTLTHDASSAMQQDQEVSPSEGPRRVGGGRRREKERERERKHRNQPEPPPKVSVTVETQAKAFRCVVLPSDTWGHLCALVQVCVCVCVYSSLSPACLLARPPSPRLPDPPLAVAPQHLRGVAVATHLQAEMGFRDPPQLSRDGWTREPKPSVKIQVL